MGSSDPDLRMRQLAKLRAAYDASLGMPDDQARRSGVRLSKALLGRILVVLGGMREGETTGPGA